MDFCRTSGKRSGLLPVRLGQRAHAPAFGSGVPSCGSNGAFVRSRWISRSIHARSSRTVVASAFLSFRIRSEEHTSELQSQSNLVCRLLLEKKKKQDSPAHAVTIPQSLGLL